MSSPGTPSAVADGFDPALAMESLQNAPDAGGELRGGCPAEECSQQGSASATRLTVTAFRARVRRRAVRHVPGPKASTPCSSATEVFRSFRTIEKLFRQLVSRLPAALILASGSKYGLVWNQRGNRLGRFGYEKEGGMAKDHGPSVKDDKQYEGLRKKGMSKERAAKIANTPNASKKGGKQSGKKSDS